MLTAAVQDKALDLLGSGVNVEEQTEKKTRGTGKNGSKKGLPRSHPWDDTDSELLVALRANGTSFNEVTKTNFKQWSCIGLRAKYLRLLRLPKWKDRLGHIGGMTQFDRLGAICEAQLHKAHSCLRRTKNKQGTKAQGKEKWSLTDNFIEDDSLESSASDGIDDYEIDEIPLQQKPKGKCQYVRSGKYSGNIKKKSMMHVMEEPATEDDHRTSRNDALQEKTKESDAAGDTNNTVDKTIPEIHETPPSNVASSVRVPEVIVIDSSDDDLPISVSRRLLRTIWQAAVMNGSEEYA